MKKPYRKRRGIEEWGSVPEDLTVAETAQYLRDWAEESHWVGNLWGECVLHLLDALDKRTKALERIRHARPDQLDHSLDVALIERVARVAREALEEE